MAKKQWWIHTKIEILRSVSNSTLTFFLYSNLDLLLTFWNWPTFHILLWLSFNVPALTLRILTLTYFSHSVIALRFIFQPWPTFHIQPWPIFHAPPDVRQHAHEEEARWFQEYNKMLAGFMLSTQLDLTQHRSPPKALYVEVRCLEDFGELETEEGIRLNLRKDSHHLMLRHECEGLIRQGVLEQVDWGVVPVVRALFPPLWDFAPRIFTFSES